MSMKSRLPCCASPPPVEQVSDLTGSFRLFRKQALETIMPLCKSKG